MKVEKTYKCIKGFSVNKYDDAECLIEDERFKVPTNSLWYFEEDSYSANDIRLESELGWLDISLEVLKERFEEIPRQQSDQTERR